MHCEVFPKFNDTKKFILHVLSHYFHAAITTESKVSVSGCLSGEFE